MQVVNISAYIQSQISTVSAQSGFYEGHMAISDVYVVYIYICLLYILFSNFCVINITLRYSSEITVYTSLIIHISMMFKL